MLVYAQRCSAALAALKNDFVDLTGHEAKSCDFLNAGQVCHFNLLCTLARVFIFCPRSNRCERKAKVWEDHGVQLTVFWATLRRRWYFVIIALVCTAVASYVTVDKVGPTYEANGAVLLLPPVTTVEKNESDTVGNPYLLLDGLGQIRDIVIRTMLAQATHDELCRPQAEPAYESMREELCGPHPGVTYDVTQDYTNRAPIILVTVEANSTTNMVTALSAVVDRVPIILTDLQAGLKVKPNAEITSAVLVSDKKPEIVRKSQIRAGIAVGAGTLALSLLMIGLLDGLLAARRSKKSPDGPARVLSSELDAPEPVARMDAEAEPGTAMAARAAPGAAVGEQPASRDVRRAARAARE